MHVRPRHLAATAITLVASGAGAAPALAASPSPLVQSIEKVQDGIRQNFDGGLSTRPQEQQLVRNLIANADRCEQAAATVARVHASPSQRAGKAEWLSGVRLQANFDVLYAAGEIAALSGNRSSALKQMHAALSLSNRADGLIGRADQVLGVKDVHPMPKR